MPLSWPISIESGNIEITATADLKTFTVNSSKTQDESVAYEALHAKLAQLLN